MAETAVITYSIILGIVLLFFILKFRSINITILSIGLYFISSLTSIYFFYNGTRDYNSISYEPIFFLLLCITLTHIPLVKYDLAKNDEIYSTKNSQKFIYYSMLFFSFIAIEPFLENIIHLPSVLTNQSSLADIYEDRADGSGAKNEYLSWIGRKLFWINFLLRDIIPLLLCYYLAKVKKINLKILLGLILSILNPIIHSFALGGRSTVINTAFYLIFTYILFRPYFETKRRLISDKVLLFSTGLIFISITIITTVRFMAQSNISVDIWTWVSLYTGEGILNFSNNLWPVDLTCNGDNTFLGIRYILGLTDSIDIESVRATRDILGVNNLVFYTYIGTIYYDFNKLGTPIFILIFIFLFTKITKSNNKRIRFSQLFYLAILGKVLMMGVMFYPYTLWYDQIALLFVLIFTWILSSKEKK